MRKILLGLACAAALALTGCGKTIDGTGPAADQVASVIADVQANVKTACGYVVAASSVANILTAIGVPYVGMAADVAQQVCGALTTVSARRGGPSVIVNGRRIAIKARRA